MDTNFDLSKLDLSNVDLSKLDLSFIDRIVLWYGTLPDSVRTLITVAVGGAVAYVVFRIVIKIIKGMIGAAVAAVLAFLLTTVPGNMLLSQAFDRVEQQISTSLSSNQ
ncbi:hypothetical protein JS533_004425 [Bifidobacterium amazonense]|uniref:Uncharacterized protein n=1 Tax=Bifidobacterium amazonense TaxID=2809027 RepID=A0ABS9VTW0_9BIFI|nr:hypothetical protein [Bifidobacterium amazonense]MCH9275523.1 hypothetical protein [Bifidobacterium amazonense]